jgi:hypothetical protein
METVWEEKSWDEQTLESPIHHSYATRSIGIFGLKAYDVERAVGQWDWHIYTAGESDEPFDDTYAWFGGCKEGVYCKSLEEAKLAAEAYLINKILQPILNDLHLDR